MKIKHFRCLFLWTLSITFLFVCIIATPAQSASGKDDENDAQESLQGLTESVLIDGQPVLRILSRKNGSTEVKLIKRDGEDAFVFEAHKISFKLPEGKLFVTKNEVIFDPYEKKSAYFKFSKADITKVSVKKQIGADGQGSVSIDTKKDGESITLLFNGEGYAIGSKKFVMPALYFVKRTIENFDSALAEFNKLTENIRPKDEESEEVEEEETETDVSDKYDRFQDVTIVSTSKMLVKGNKRSIRTYAEYNYESKTKKKPEKVSLYFYVSASRPVFQEDNLKLNFLVDDRRVPLGEMKLTEEKTKTSTKQTVVVTMPYETFEQIANGKTVEFQIGTLEYKMSDVTLEGFRKLLSYKAGETK